MVTNTNLPDNIKNIVYGITPGYDAFAVRDFLAKNKCPFIYVAVNQTKAYEFYEQFRNISPLNCYFLPAWDCLPYDRVSPSLDIMIERVQTLLEIMEQGDQPFCLVISSETFVQFLPPLESLRENTLLFKIGTTIDWEKFLQVLTDKGYNRVHTVRETGEYAVRGSLIDLFPLGEEKPLRLDFFGNTLESLRFFDPIDQKSFGSTDQFSLKNVGEIVLNQLTIELFRKNYRALFGPTTDLIYESISQGLKFPGMEHWLPLFFEKCAHLIEYIPNAHIIFAFQADKSLQTRLELIQSSYATRKLHLDSSLNAHKSIRDFEEQSLYRPIPPNLLYWNERTFQDFIHNHPNVYQFTPFLSNQNNGETSIKRGIDFSSVRNQENDAVYNALIDFLNEKSSHKKIILACPSPGIAERLNHNLIERGFNKAYLEIEKDLQNSKPWPDNLEASVCISVFPLEQGFETPNTIFITQFDLWGESKLQSKRQNKKGALLLKEISQLNEGDFVVHREHGIAKYIGLETLTVNKLAHDCLRLIFAGDDKLFVPVENIDVITRYGNDETPAQLDKLGSTGWQLRKAKVKKRIREIADYLIKLAAERALKTGDAFQPNVHALEEFEEGFPYAETEDQQRAIEETLADLSSGHPMDRLVCGDVGFGKTEVALRAAFAAVSSGKQVAIISPTTLLCRQHFHTFKERFKNFPYQVAQLSRFVKVKEKTQILKQLAEGRIDIVVATHSLLSADVKLPNLGLLIVDEEQHFGVKQKEKLKELKNDVHVLTLTATPIPRTLQLALTGVRGMSLITTPPIDRRIVQTFVMPFDGVVIREAILREYYRGGQIFYVCPRLKEIEQLELKIKVLIPEIKIAVAHGQMNPTDLEDVMSRFVDKHFDLLLSTNIVESGIDIANANTLIIHRADLFGLAQLYQLRGRVGRGKVQAYAYLTIPPNQAISTTAQKRLEFLQTLDKLGAGFSLASYDMDIRGAGNILGEEQSGHIREVGVELYQHLLQEAILNLRKEQSVTKENMNETKVGIREVEDADWSPHINVGLSVLIPTYYVPDMDLRLSLYKEISALRTREEVETFAADMIDRFGPLTEEVKNLLSIIEIKQLCIAANIQKLDTGEKGIVIRFYKDQFPNVPALLNYVQRQNGAIKIRPDQSLVIVGGEGFIKNRVSIIKRLCRDFARLC